MIVPLKNIEYLVFISKDENNKWCALFGENIQNGMAGFGNNPIEALQNMIFEMNKEFYKEEN